MPRNSNAVRVIIGRPHTEDDGTKESAGGEHRQNPERTEGATRQKAFSLGLSLDLRS